MGRFVANDVLKNISDNDFTNTPSFYNNKETFNKYLGQTSYYLGLQKALLHLIKLSQPHHKKVLELGFGTGQTAIKLAQETSHYQITALDLREEMIKVAKDLLFETYHIVSNENSTVDFIAGDMCEYVKNDLSSFDFIYLLYSFHHIEDPLDRKIEFLQDCYKNMKSGAYLCIAETFIPESRYFYDDDFAIYWLFMERAKEGYASTFWSCLDGLSKKQLSEADKIASYCKDMELEAGRLVVKRENEYLIKKTWLKKQVKLAGFKVVFDKDVNCLGDAVMLLQKK